ncbi:MAG: TRAP transporter small permease subunit [Pseudomonadota bacterium]
MADQAIRPAELSTSALPATTGTQAIRAFAWIMVAGTFVYMINNWLMFWQDWPGIRSMLGGEISGLGIVQLLFYVAATLGCIFYVARGGATLREDSARMTAITNFIIRAAFWAVFLVGVVDAIVSFLRVEEMLAGFVGDELAGMMNFNSNRAPMVHGPLIVLAIILAMFTRRTIGFHWLALLVVIAELNIVLSRFIFSYEQAFMGDLVRFWYGALFLFASAFTLFEDGHVRVDVLYAGFKDRTKGFVNAWGSILMGILFCWVVIWMGMDAKTSIINAPLVSLEVSQSGFGMYVKYLMAGFLAVFAVSMMVQFCAYLLESVADYRGDPGSRLHAHDDELPGH